MSNDKKKYYFSIVKLGCLIVLLIYFISSTEESLHNISMEWFLLCVTLAASLSFELCDEAEKKQRLKKIFCLVLEFTCTFLLIFFYRESDNGIFLLPMIVLDSVIFLKLPFAFSALAFIGLFIVPNNFNIYFAYCLFLTIIYYQNYYIIENYRKNLMEFEQEEYRLKDSIHDKDTFYKEELERSSLLFENQILEEKARLSQALHDQLGHSINGSIYQLEACKVLMDKDKEESTKIVQGVINNLRTSMDDIRSILRRERPDKKRMAYLQLMELCEECKKKYGIEAELRFKGGVNDITENHWEVILDNSLEAVTNALKYSGCSRVTIELSVLHKVIRCSIADNGVGCHLMKEGMGIQGMKNRVRKMNGIIDIDGEHGFRINMLLPLK